MDIQTKYLGEIEIDQEKIIQFPEGLPGFIEEKEFVLLHIPDNDIFQTLQSVKTPTLAFIIANPYRFYENYIFDLDESVVQKLQIKKPEDVAVYTIVTVKEPFSKSTLNLKAPLVIHSAHKQGKQYILNLDDYPAKAPLVPPETTKAKGD
ncbi:flagellar assembly protein FliW [Virgibacillus sp. W0181]|uniref:flagellar assembly protein FliW n=1 Tax=Virgibacillus sp. W0181 TaxID=3391581 RepID=UPI003F462B25